MEPMYIAKDKLMNILSYVDFSKLCHVVKYSTEWNKHSRQKYINFPLSSSSRDIEWRNEHRIEL